MAETPASLGTLSADRQELLRRLLKKKGVETTSLARLPRRPDPAAPAPLSFAQRRLWFLDRLDPGSPLYNVPASVVFPDELDPIALQAALSEVIRRHEALRTTFVEIAGEPRQVVGPPFVPEVPLVDLEGLPEERAAAEGSRLVQAETGRPFDLARGPLLRVVLVRLPFPAVPLTAEDLGALEDPDDPCLAELDKLQPHALLATLHHIVSDGWSCGLLLREVITLGDAVRTGRPHGLPDLPVQYADYATWQNEQLAGEALGQQLAWWRETLAGVPEALELPFDRPRPAVPSGRGGRRRLTVPPATASAVRALASQLETTPFVVLLSGFMALLGRLAGQERFAVGTVVAGRNREEVAHLIGFFVNTLALPADLSGDPAFAEIVRRTKDAANGAFSNQELPFERLVEELAPERVAGRNPLFQVVFALQIANNPATGETKTKVELMAVERDTAKFDLSLSLSETAEEWGGELEYAADLFDPTTAARLADRLVKLLAEATQRPEIPLSALAWLDEAERHQLLQDWNDTAVAGPAWPSIPAAVAAQVARVPDAVALAQGEAQLSYGELKARAAAVARRLRRAGVGPEVRVGVSLERSPELVVALLAILEAGGAYVPLDLEYPEARLATLLRAARVPLVVSSRRFAGHPWLADSGVPVLFLEEAAGEAAPADGPFALASLDPANLAFVPFTSGSTGEPKGVAVTHRGLLRLVLEGGYVRFGRHERFLSVAVVSFDASSVEIWGALVHGARLALLPPGAPSIDGLAAELALYEVTTLWLTAGLFHAVVESRPQALSGVRQLQVGGEVLSPEMMRRTLAELPGIELTACYGPTEVTTFTSTWRAVAAELAHTVPIGRPIGNTLVRVLDSNFEPVPIGVAGELLAGGAGLARGYAGRADATAERFVPDPWSETPGERLYRTGDRVRWRADGTLEFLGRFDDQVKVRGFRVEPREVEAALLACPGVAMAVVLATAPRPGESRRLVAFVVGEGLSAEALATEIRRRLPEFMVPQAFALLPELPLSPTGKVDRRALAGEVERSLAATAEGLQTPLSTPIEELLAAVWSEVLGVPAVGAGDSFFALGGHSLLAIRAAALLRDVFGVDVPLRDFFETPDLAALAGRIDQLRGSGAALGFPPIERRPEGEPAPLSFAQERLWFLDRLTPEPAIYNVPEVERIRGPFDGEALEAALKAVVERHEILRTRFAQGADGAPVQIVEPVPERLLARIDLTALSAGAVGAPAAAEAEMAFWIWREAFRPFDLGRSPMIRAALFRLADQDHAWGVVRHHIATDGWSAEIFRRELTALYAAAFTGSPSLLTPLAVQYADFAAWQRRYLGDEILSAQLAYWRAQLAGAPPLLELPADRPRPRALGHAGEIRTTTISEALAGALQDLARRAGATRYMVLLAAFETLLARYTGRGDLVVGTPVANRRRAEVQELIGFFANTLALRTDLGGDPTFAEALGRVRATALAAYDHQDLPFERLVEELNPARDPSYPPLVQILFVQQAKSRREEAPGDPGGPANLAFSRVEGDRALSRFDVELYVFEVGDELELALEYRTDLYDRPRMERMLGHLTTLLAAVAEDAGRRLSDLPLLSAAERQQLLEEWGKGEEISGGPFLHERFAARARMAPEVLALVAIAGTGTVRLTYGELDRASGRLAADLTARGIGRGDRVGILSGRDAGLIAGLLGILKAGAAYVALDPAYPEARLSRIAADAGLAALLVGEGVEGLLGEVSVPRLPLDLAVALSPVPSPETGEGDLTEGERGTRTSGAEEASFSLPPQYDSDRDLGNTPSYAFPSPVAGEGPGERATVRARLAPDDLAYLLYTSGSTGTPKGVAIRHGAAAALVRWALSEYRPEELARVLAATSINFDLSVFEIFVPLAAGGTVVLVEDALALPGLGEAVTLVNTVPSVIAEVARRGLPAGIKVINLAGEPLRRELADTLLVQVPAARLFNLYGPSEDTTYSTGSQVEPGVAAEPTIGRALPGSYARVLDGAGQPLPIGVPGELCLGGEGLARGYFGRPDLTALAFVPAAEAGRPGERLYRTGDLARWTEDGELQFLGRIDHQVKVRGFRIELAEIDGALALHPALAQAAVVTAGQGEDRRLVAFVAPAEGAGAVAPDGLRAFLKQSLPDYMVPAVFVELPALPLSPSGKVDRKALIARLEAEGGIPLAREARAAFSPPQGEIESGLAGIWEGLLERAPVGRDDSFFDLGGHSLQGVRLLIRITQAFGVELPLRTIFEATTLAALAGRIAEARDGQEGPDGLPRVFPIPRAGRSDPLPLSFAQERIWFLHSLAPGSAAYNLPAAFHLSGPLDLAALGAAVGEVVRRHEVLRTRYEVVDGVPRAVLSRALEGGADLAEVDLSALPDPPGVARELVAREVERPFDLAARPVVRTLLLRLGPGEHAFVLNAHHIACDGWSLGLWAREIETLYRDAAAGRPPSLPSLPIQYGDFAVWQRRWLDGEEVERQIEWWRESLAGAPARLELPADRPRQARPGSGGGAVSALLPAALSARLRALANRSETSLFMVLLAALATLLGRLAGTSDLVIGSPVAGRNRAEIEGLIGCFLNTLALRVDLSCHPSFAALLARVRERALGAFAHQDVPFERLLAELNPERDTARTPLFQVLLNVLNTPEARLDLPGLALTSFPLPEALAKFDLTLYAQESGDALGFHLVYAADLFDRDRMEELLRQLGGLLEQIAEAPERPVGDLSLLTPAAAALLPDPREPLDRTFRGAVHDLFRSQAARLPEHPALIDAGGAVFSYRALDETAGRLAAHLAARGIGKGDRVALWAHRDPLLVAAILAVLETGAAYLVLDSKEGVARLAAKLRLADPRAVLLLPGAGPLPAELEEPARGRIVAWPPEEDDEPAGLDAFPTVGPGDLACLSFTSGSTGEPKGVLQAHGSMSYFLPWFAETLSITPADRFSMLSGLAHDPLQRDLFHPLAHGATLAIPDPERIGAPGYLAGWMHEHAVTLAHLTPAMGQLLCDSAAPGASLPALRWAIFGGDALSFPLLERVRRLAPNASFLNLFGATETHRALAAARVELPQDPAHALPLGRGIPGSQLLVLDESGNLTGIGELGQIALRSPHLALGYLGDDELTRARFRTNADDATDRLYLTGDLGRFRPDGTVEPAGRADRQIQIRGFRVEPAEIEAALARLPQIRAAAVRPWTHRGERRLAAYLTAEELLDTAALRRKLRETLPEALVPAAFVQLDRLPLSPSGKVDLDALPEPFLAEGAGEEDRAAPRDPLEMRLLAIWQEVLEVDSLGVDDDFFARGGHSLLAVRLLARIAEDLGRRLPLGTLFRATTVRELAALLRNEAPGELAETAETPLVRLRDIQDGDGPPLFLLHPLGGQVLAYRPLLEALPSGFAIFALQDTFPAEELRTLASLAAAYLQEIRRVQPHGPYRLAGWSFGGRLAFEMAGQLHEAGETVGFVGLLDTGLARPEARAAESDAAVLAEVFPDLAADLAELPEGADALNELLARGAAAGTLPPGLTPSLARRRLDLLKAHYAIGPRDRPRFYPGTVDLFVAAETWPERTGTDPSHGWAVLCGNLILHRVPGDHLSLMQEPHVRELARRVGGRLG